MKKFNQKGQALIEALLALSLAAIVISVVTFLVINALSDTTYAKSQTAAASYAKQGVEYVRSLRDQSYSNFDNYSGAYCLNESFQLPSGTCSSANYLDGDYARQVTFTRNSPSCSNGTLITSSVSWTDSKCDSGALCRNVTIYTCLATDNTYTP